MRVFSQPGASAQLFAMLVGLAVFDQVDPAAASATLIEAATATQVTTRAITSIPAPAAAAMLACPRQVRFTTAGSTASDAPATATIVGQTLAGPVTEVVTLAQTATTADSANFWTRIDSITYAAGDGTGGTVAIGITAALGLPVKAKGRGASGAVFVVVGELVDGAVPTAGVLTGPATSKPFGSYAPNSAPNAARDYQFFYEADV